VIDPAVSRASATAPFRSCSVLAVNSLPTRGLCRTRLRIGAGRRCVSDRGRGLPDRHRRAPSRRRGPPLELVPSLQVTGEVSSVRPPEPAQRKQIQTSAGRQARATTSGCSTRASCARGPTRATAMLRSTPGGIGLDFIPPGTIVENSFVESFDGKRRDEGYRSRHTVGSIAVPRWRDRACYLKRGSTARTWTARDIRALRAVAPFRFSLRLDTPTA